MSRLAYLYRLSGELEAVTAVHVGAAGGQEGNDLEQLRDGRGRCVLPGTSLAGVIRSALGNPGLDQRWWWGFVDGGGEGSASRVTIADAPQVAEFAMEVRDGVSIDRFTGAAAARHLFSRSVIPAGSKFTFNLEIEAPAAADDARARELAGSIDGLLRGPGIALGAAVTRGLGRMRLVDAKLVRHDFTCPEGLRAFLRGESQPVENREQQAVASGTLRITVPWWPLGPVLSKIADQGGACQAFPATTTMSDGVHLLIPGSSLKGVLRSHAERIVRTLTECPLGAGDDFGEQMSQAGHLPGIGDVFGSKPHLSGGDQGRRGLLAVSDVVSVAAVEPETWDRIRRAPGESSDAENTAARRELAECVKNLNGKTAAQGLWFDLATRNAIDRWTGAAADALLFTALEPYAVGSEPVNAWRPLVLELDVGRARRRPAVSVDALIALLVLLLRDFAEGWIPIGSGTTRGLGAVRADAKAIRFDFAGAGADGDHVLSLHGMTLHDVLQDDDLTTAIQNAWQKALLCPA